jgi:hypothetical protein
MLSQDLTEFPDLVKEEVRVPMFAVELVPLDVRKHPVSQRDHLIVRGAILIRFQ